MANAPWPSQTMAKRQVDPRGRWAPQLDSDECIGFEAPRSIVLTHIRWPLLAKGTTAADMEYHLLFSNHRS